ncbi:hypothetical protein PanWU01x14_280300 [Parasponia andersonii]|uniref:Secreted protein n=1 Tax=Parasponia andersonii TaxID=3476 RepID=A0A2P5B1K1_PARAD|nr:hypothetical protein PanWU01x14_280300 [Parasponia andersonii]
MLCFLLSTSSCLSRLLAAVEEETSPFLCSRRLPITHVLVIDPKSVGHKCYVILASGFWLAITRVVLALHASLFRSYFLSLYRDTSRLSTRLLSYTLFKCSRRPSFMDLSESLLSLCRCLPITVDLFMGLYRFCWKLFTNCIGKDIARGLFGPGFHKDQSFYIRWT